MGNTPKSSNPWYKWHFPYVDVSFYDENATHLWDSDPDFHEPVFDKSKIFPLHKRPIADQWVNAPMDSYYYLNTTYKNPSCQTYHYSHKYETTKLRTWIQCKKLKRYYGFVYRTPREEGVMETLKVGDDVKHSFLVNEPRDNIPKPFTLELDNR